MKIFDGVISLLELFFITFNLEFKKSFGFPDNDTVLIFLREKFGACSSMRVLLDSRNTPGPFDKWKHTISLKVLNLPHVLLMMAIFSQIWKFLSFRALFADFPLGKLKMANSTEAN